MTGAYKASSFSAFSAAGGGSACTVTAGAAAAVGDRIIVPVITWHTGAAPATLSITDSLHGATTYGQDSAGSQTDGTFQLKGFIYSLPVTTAGTPTVTVAPTTDARLACCLIATGLDTTSGGGLANDKSAVGTGAGGTASSGALAALSAQEFVIAVYVDDGWAVALGSGSIGAGWTFLGAHSDGSVGDMLVEYQVANSGATPAGNLASGVPGGSATWIMSAIAYNNAGGAPSFDPSTVPPLVASSGQPLMRNTFSS